MVIVRGARNVDATPTHDLVEIFDPKTGLPNGDVEPAAGCKPTKGDSGRNLLAKRREEGGGTELHVNALAVKGVRHECAICGAMIEDDRMALVPVA